MRRAVLAQPGVELRLGQGVVGAGARRRLPTGRPRITGVTPRGRHGAHRRRRRRHDRTTRRPARVAGRARPRAGRDRERRRCRLLLALLPLRPTTRTSASARRSAAGIGAGVIGSDAGTYSVTAVVDRADKELRTHLSDSDRFDATMRLLPELDDVTAAERRADPPRALDDRPGQPHAIVHRRPRRTDRRRVARMRRRAHVHEPRLRARPVPRAATGGAARRSAHRLPRPRGRRSRLRGTGRGDGRAVVPVLGADRRDARRRGRAFRLGSRPGRIRARWAVQPATTPTRSSCAPSCGCSTCWSSRAC